MKTARKGPVQLTARLEDDYHTGLIDAQGNRLASLPPAPPRAYAVGKGPCEPSPEPSPEELRARADAIEAAQARIREERRIREEQEAILAAKRQAVNEDRLFACQVCAALNEVDRLNDGGIVAALPLPVDAAERVSQVLAPHGYGVTVLAGTCWVLPL